MRAWRNIAAIHFSVFAQGEEHGEASGLPWLLVVSVVAASGRVMAQGAAAQPVAISGKLLLPDGAAATGKTLIVIGPQDKEIVSGAVPDQKHAFEFDSKGTYSIQAPGKVFRMMVLTDAGYAVVLSEDLEKSTDVKLQPWAHLKGTYLKLGVPAVKEPVVVELFGDKEFDAALHKVHWEATAQTDENGHFEFPKVMGGVTLQLADGMGGMGEQPEHPVSVTIDPGQTKEVTFPLGREVKGKLVGVAGKKLPEKVMLTSIPAAPKVQYMMMGTKRVAVFAMNGMPQSYISREVAVNADGTFSATDFPEGNYRLVAVGENVVGTQRFGVKVEGAKSAMDIGEVHMRSYTPAKVGMVAPDVPLTVDVAPAKSLKLLKGKYVLLVLGRRMDASGGLDLAAGELEPRQSPASLVKVLVDVSGKDELFTTDEQGQFPASARILETDARTLDAFDGYVLPTAVLIDPAGRIVATGLRSRKAIEDAITQAGVK